MQAARTAQFREGLGVIEAIGGKDMIYPLLASFIGFISFSPERAKGLAHDSPATPRKRQLKSRS